MRYTFLILGLTFLGGLSHEAAAWGAENNCPGYGYGYEPNPWYNQRQILNIIEQRLRNAKNGLELMDAVFQLKSFAQDLQYTGNDIRREIDSVENLLRIIPVDQFQRRDALYAKQKELYIRLNALEPLLQRCVLLIQQYEPHPY